MLYLPLHSPDLNPIENAFAKLKVALRRAAERTRDALWAAIARALPTITSAECAHYFANAAYRGT